MDSQWLQQQFSYYPDKSKSALARALNLESPAVSKILNGSRQIKAHEYLTMRKFFGLPVDGERSVQVKSNQNEMELSPLTYSHGASERDSTEFTQNWTLPADILRSQTNATPDQIKVFKNNESVMTPDFKKGEYVLVDLSIKTPTPAGAFIISDGFGYMIRDCRYIPLSSPPRITISAKQPNFQPHDIDIKDIQISTQHHPQL